MKTTRLAGVIRTDILKLINAEPFTTRSLLDLVRVAKAAAGLLQATDANSGKKLKDMMPALLDEPESTMATASPGETYGVKILRDLMASIPKWQPVSAPSAVRIETSLTDLTMALRAATEAKNEPLAKQIQDAMAKMVTPPIYMPYVAGPPAKAVIKATGVPTTPAGGVVRINGWIETDMGNGIRKRVRDTSGVVPAGELADMTAAKLPKKKTRGAFHQYMRLAKRRVDLKGIPTPTELASERSWYKKLTKNERELVESSDYRPLFGVT